MATHSSPENIAGEKTTGQTPSHVPWAIEVNDLSFDYTSDAAHPVIQINQWQVAMGKRIFLHGRSGSGKSTLLNLLCGTLSPQSGNIQLIGQPFSALSSRKRDKFRAKHIGVVFQQFNLIPYLTVMDNIMVALHFAGSKKNLAQEQIESVFAQLHLDLGLLNRRADQLSVGQQQRVSIARSLINHPEIIIADEPTSALDADAQSGFMDLLIECTEKAGSTLLFVSHDHRLATFFEQQLEITDLNHNGQVVIC